MPTRTIPRSTFLSCSIAVFLGSGAAFAAQNSATLPEVVVTADTTDTAAATPDTSVVSPSAATAKQRIQETPGAMNVVTPQNFKLGRGSYTEDFLQYSPGVTIQAVQGSEDTHLSIRGSGQDNDDIIGLTVLIDGIPLNQGDGEAYLHDLDMHSVTYAEVYRGADAFRFGGVALGGAVNFITPTGRDADPFTLHLNFGSFGLFEQEATTGWANGPWDIYASATQHVLNGYREHSQENYQKVFFSLGYKFNENAENRLYFFYGHLEQNSPSAITKDAMYANPRQANADAVAQDWGTKWHYFRFMDKFAVKGDDWKFQIAAEYNHRQVTKMDQFDDDFRLGSTRYYSDDAALDITYENTTELFGQKNRFTIGIVPSWEAESDSSYENNGGHLGALLFHDRTYYTNIPFFVENQHYFTKELSLYTGFQVVYVNRIFRGENAPPSTVGFVTRDDHFLSIDPKIGLSYQWTDKNMAFINVSRSFQPPSFDESLKVIEGETGGQHLDDLSSQKAITLEVGTRGESGPFEWDFAIYRTWLRDELIDQNNAQGVSVGSINAPHTIHQGLEIGLETEVAHDIFVKSLHTDASKDGKTMAVDRKADRLVLVQSYNFSDFRFSADPVYGNNRIAGSPVHTYKAELRYEHPSGVYFGPNVEWNITKYPVDEANTLYAEPYALMGLRAGYKTKKGLQVYFEVKNLFDKTYAANVEPIADARNSDDTDSFNPGNGRAFYGGVSWIW